MKVCIFKSFLSHSFFKTITQATKYVLVHVHSTKTMETNVRLFNYFVDQLLMSYHCVCQQTCQDVSLEWIFRQIFTLYSIVMCHQKHIRRVTHKYTGNNQRQGAKLCFLVALYCIPMSRNTITKLYSIEVKKDVTDAEEFLLVYLISLLVSLQYPGLRSKKHKIYVLH